jgi:hypothetical protein
LTGILVFAQPLFRLVTVRSRFIRYAWAIIAVSIAAQIPIAPAMIYYFGQMSTLSPVMSIAAIPAAFCVVAGGIGIMVMAMIFPGVTHFVADVVTWIIRTLNTMASRASDLSFSYLPIQMDAGALVFVYLVAGCLVMRFLTANRRWTLYAVLPALAATIISAIHIKTTLHTPVMAIFPGSPASIEYYYRGGCHSTVVPGTLSNFDSTALLKARHMHFINRIIRDSCASGSSIATVEMSDAIIHIAGTHTSSDSIASNAHRQFLYITAVPDSASLSKLLVSGVGQVIMAAHLWQRERTMIIRMCDRALIPWHDMRSHGAYYCKLTR